MKNIIFLFSMQNPGMLAFNIITKNVSLASNSCAGWVGRAGNLIAAPAVNSPCTKYRLGCQLFPVGKHLAVHYVYYTVFEFHEDAQGGSKSFRRDDLPFLIYP